MLAVSPQEQSLPALSAGLPDLPSSMTVPDTPPGHGVSGSWDSPLPTSPATYWLTPEEREGPIPTSAANLRVGPTTGLEHLLETAGVPSPLPDTQFAREEMGPPEPRKINALGRTAIATGLGSLVPADLREQFHPREDLNVIGRVASAWGIEPPLGTVAAAHADTGAPLTDTRGAAQAAMAANAKRIKDAADANRPAPPPQLQRPDIRGDYGGGFGRPSARSGPIGQTKFTNADLAWYHANPEQGAVSTFEPGPGSDYYAEKQGRELRDQMMKARIAQAAYETSQFTPVAGKPGEPTRLGMEVQAQKAFEGALATREAEHKQIDHEELDAFQKWAANLGIDYNKNPAGIGLDQPHQQMYQQRLADIRRSFDRRRSAAEMRLAWAMDQGRGGGAFSRGYLGDMGKAAGRAQGKEMAGEDDFGGS